jgi:enoyl-CoA hydratase/carnithine racemase
MPLDAERAQAMGFADFVCEEGEDLEHAAWRLLLTSFLRHTTGAFPARMDACMHPIVGQSVGRPASWW